MSRKIFYERTFDYASLNAGLQSHEINDTLIGNDILFYKGYTSLVLCSKYLFNLKMNKGKLIIVNCLIVLKKIAY